MNEGGGSRDGRKQKKQGHSANINLRLLKKLSQTSKTNYAKVISADIHDCIFTSNIYYTQ